MAGLLDFLQSASNSVAGNVTGPVDGIAWLLRKAGLDVGEPVGGSDWAKRKGLMRDVPQSGASLAGETAGLLSPIVAAAKAPQIAKGLLQMGENAAAPRTVNAGLIGSQRGAVVSPDGVVRLKVTALDGTKKPAPVKFYRGETPGADRVLTRNANWDQSLFAADDPTKAALYGANVTAITAKPGANLLYEGSKEFKSLMKGVGKNQSMLSWASEATRRAKEAGFDAVWFKRQGDLGTAILDRSKFDIDGALINTTGGVR